MTSGKISLKKIVTILFFLLLVIVPPIVAHTDFATRWQLWISEQRNIILEFGRIEMATATTLIYAALVAIGAPRTWLAVPAAALFGLSIGFTVSLIGSLLGSWLTFAIVRRFKIFSFTETSAQHNKLRQILEKDPGILGIAAIRQIPLPGIIVSSALATGKCSTTTFVVGTLLGYSISALLVCLAAASATYAGF